jgi:hypothetical protein
VHVTWSKILFYSITSNNIANNSDISWNSLYPCSPKGEGVYCFTSVRLSKIFFVAFFSVTVDGRNLIFGHKRHIGVPYCG